MVHVCPRRHRPPGFSAVVACLGLVLCARAARAAGFDVDFFKPVSTSIGYFTEENGRVLPDGALDVATTLEYLRQPLVVRDQLGGQTEGDIVRDRLTGFVTVALGIAHRVDLGFRAPMVIRQSGDVYVNISDGGGLQIKPRAPAPGDFDVLFRLRLLGDSGQGGYHMTLSAPFGFPTGAREALAGNGTVTFRPRLILGWAGDRSSISASAGYEMRRPTEIPGSGLVVGNALVAGAGALYTAMPRRLWVLAEASVSVGLAQSATGTAATPAEVMGGFRVRLPGRIVLQAGVGSGLGRGAGAAKLRGLLTLAYVWQPS